MEQNFIDKLIGIIMIGQRFLSKSPRLYRISKAVLMGLGDTGAFQRFYWKKQSFAWQKQRPPVRPSEDDLKSYRTFFKQHIRASRILLLGSTPELRYLVKKCYPYADLHIIDFLKEMYDTTTDELSKSSSISDTWVKGDWLCVKLPTESFDIVVGDVVFGQYSPSKDKYLLRRIYNALVPEGYFITRIHTIEPLPDVNSLTEDALSKYDAADRKNQALTLLWHLKYLLAGNDRRVDHQRLRDFLTKSILLFDNHPLLKASLQKLTIQETKFPFKWIWAPPDNRDLLKMTGPFFRIIRKRVSQDYHDANCYPTFLLQKKLILKRESLGYD